MSQRAGGVRGSRPATPAKPGPDRLASWKEIAAHLGVTVRTAQRWERFEGLPVHRQMHATLASAYAVGSELDAWRAARPDPRAPAKGRSRASRSIAVLPFANLTRDLETEILADGLTEELISTLAQVPGLGVVARTSVFYFKDKNVDIREVGAKLGVDSVLEGSVRKIGGRIRVVAQLIDARSGLHVWSEPFESGRPDLLSLQQDLAHAVAGTLRATLASTDGPVRGRRGESSGYGLYLEGMYYWNRRTPAGFLKAVECFERVVEDDPRMAPAWAALAECYGNASAASTLAPDEGRKKAVRAARTALELDPSLAEAHVSLGGLAAVHAFDWKDAESHFLRALELKPHLAPAHLFYAALVLAPAGRLAEAEVHQTAASDLDPLSPPVVNATGMLRLMLRQYDRAAAAFRASLDLDPDYPWANRGLGEVHLLQGRYREAVAPLSKVEMPGQAAGFLGYCYARLGLEGEARQLLTRLEHSGYASVSYQIAVLHLGLDDIDAAFHWLDRACADRSTGVMWLPVDPIWDAVRSDGRFASVVASMGLDPASARWSPGK